MHKCNLSMVCKSVQYKHFFFRLGCPGTVYSIVGLTLCVKVHVDNTLFKELSLSVTPSHFIFSVATEKPSFTHMLVVTTTATTTSLFFLSSLQNPILHTHTFAHAVQTRGKYTHQLCRVDHVVVYCQFETLLQILVGPNTKETENTELHMTLPCVTHTLTHTHTMELG